MRFEYTQCISSITWKLQIKRQHTDNKLSMDLDVRDQVYKQHVSMQYVDRSLQIIFRVTSAYVVSFTRVSRNTISQLLWLSVCWPWRWTSDQTYSQSLSTDTVPLEAISKHYHDIHVIKMAADKVCLIPAPRWNNQRSSGNTGDKLVCQGRRM